jgi:hypothetical protein
MQIAPMITARAVAVLPVCSVMVDLTSCREAEVSLATMSPFGIPLCPESQRPGYGRADHR